MADLEIYGEVCEFTPEQLFNACSKKEKNQLRRLLMGVKMSVSEKIFEEHLDAIHGKWNVLSNEDEEQIMKIGKKFI